MMSFVSIFKCTHVLSVWVVHMSWLSAKATSYLASCVYYWCLQIKAYVVNASTVSIYMCWIQKGKTYWVKATAKIESLTERTCVQLKLREHVYNERTCTQWENMCTTPTERTCVQLQLREHVYNSNWENMCTMREHVYNSNWENMCTTQTERTCVQWENMCTTSTERTCVHLKLREHVHT